MGGAPALLRTGRRRAAFAVLAGALVAYYAVAESLWNVSVWWDVAFFALVLMPAVFTLVYVVLPLRRTRGLPALGLAFVALAAVTAAADLDTVSDFAKLGATTALGFWFLTYFESVVWVALIALLIPWVDAYSVARGPTNNIIENHPGTFTEIAFRFPELGTDRSAQLGPPDLLFFALFLAASARFGLRPRLTWLAMTLSFGATIALAVWLDLEGLPALPGLSIGFVAPNADLLWRALRRRRPAS